MLDKTEMLWGGFNATFKVDQWVFEFISLSLELFILISCNKGQELNNLVVQDLSCPQFHITLSSHIAFVNVRHMGCIALNF